MHSLLLLAIIWSVVFMISLQLMTNFNLLYTFFIIQQVHFYFCLNTNEKYLSFIKGVDYPFFKKALFSCYFLLSFSSIHLLIDFIISSDFFIYQVNCNPDDNKHFLINIDTPEAEPVQDNRVSRERPPQIFPTSFQYPLGNSASIFYNALISYYQNSSMSVSNVTQVILSASNSTQVTQVISDVNHVQFIDVGSSSDPLILPYEVPFNFLWNLFLSITAEASNDPLVLWSVLPPVPLQTVTHHVIPSVVVSGFSYYYIDIFLRRQFFLYTYPAVHFTFPGSFFLGHPFIGFEDNYPNRLIDLSRRYPHISRNVYIGALLGITFYGSYNDLETIIRLIRK